MGGLPRNQHLQTAPIPTSRSKPAFEIETSSKRPPEVAEPPPVHQKQFTNLSLEGKSRKCHKGQDMQLSSSMTIAVAEDFLRRVEAGSVGDLWIPTRGKHQAAGGEAAFVQALATWANTAHPAPLITYAQGPEDKIQIDRLIRRLYGLVSILVADTIMSIRKSDLTEILQHAALGRLATLQSESPEGGSRGPQLEIVCIDHLAQSYPKSFYLRDQEDVSQVKKLPAFNKFAEAVVSELVPDMSDSLKDRFVYAFGGVLHELFRNTDEHGRANDRGDVPAKSVRGFHARRHSISPETLVALTADSAPLAEYCRRLRPPRATNRDIQLIELSVFDTGPGMAASLASQPLDTISSEEELNLVSRCFLENVSRKSLSSAGLGLPMVIDLLRERNGFLRLRTGRLALFCDLGLEGQRAFGEPPDLREWFECGINSAPVAGTLFTLMFPLGA
jgi:hypothetical protein